MTLPSLGFYTTGGVVVTTHDFGSVEAGAYKPDSTGYKLLLYNDYGGTLGSDPATSVKITVRDVDGGTDELWTKQRWIQAKSNGCSTGVGMVDDAQTVFTAVGLNKELSVGDIYSNNYRTIYSRCYPPTDAATQNVDFQLRVTHQQPATPIAKWIVRNKFNAVVPSTGDPLAMSTGGSTGGTIPYSAGYALVNDNEIYFGSSGSYTIEATTGTGTYNIYLDGTGAFGETTGSITDDQLLLYTATYTSGNCTALVDKRVYLVGFLAGTSDAKPIIPLIPGSIFFEKNSGMLYGAKTSTGWITPLSRFGSTTNYTDFETDGTMVMHGAATVWDDLRVDSLTTKVGTSKIPDFTVYKTDSSGSQGVFTYWFDKDTQEEIYFSVQMPHSWDSTDIYPHVHWIPRVTGSTTSETVEWGLEYTWANINSIYGNTNIVYAQSTSSLVGDTHYLTSFTPITPSSGQNEISSIMMCRLFRNSTGVNDTYSTDAGLLEFDIHYAMNTLGSRTELIK